MSATANTRARIVLVLAAGLSIAGIVAATSGSAAATSTPSAHVLRFGVLFSPQNVIDVPPAQRDPHDFQPGDYAVFSDQLTDRTGKTVGTEGGTGVITRIDQTGAQIYFSLTVQLPDGQVTGAGLASTAPSKTIAITGGTGRYLDAAGQLDLVENGDDTGTLTLTLTS